MSTDVTPNRWTYRRIVTLAVIGLALVAAALAAAGARQAPRVGAAQLDTAYAVQNSGSQLVLGPNQPIRAGKAVTVRTTPGARATVKEQGGRLVVTFGRPLHYDTDYAVEVGPVTGKYTGASGRLHYRFHTPDPALYALQRSGTVSDGRPDRIVELRQDGSVERTVFSDDTILEYADTGSSLVVSTLDHGVNRLVQVGLNGHVQKTFEPQGSRDGPAFGLRADPTTGLFGYVTAPHGQEGGHLYVRDVAAPSLGSTPIEASDGTAIEVLNWMLVPGSKQVVVQDTSGQVFMANPAKPTAAPTAIGTYGRLSGFVPGTSVLTLPDNTGSGIRLLDPLHGVSRTVAADSGPYSIQLLLLDEAGRSVRVDVTPGEAGQGSYQVVAVDHGKTRALLATDPGKVDDVSICLAPDGAHLAVVVQPTHGTDDGYPIQPSRAGVLTYFIDASGGSFHAAQGFEPQWCSSGPTSNGISPKGL